jgi:hypothetical protein
MTKKFFATVQNKLHFAVHSHTAAELIHDRVDSNKPLVGMTSFKGNYITRDDVKIAKNYLTEHELSQLNLLVSAFLDLAEFQAVQEHPMSMSDWIASLDRQIVAVRREILQGTGRISHEQAVEPENRDWLRADFARASASAHCSLRSTHHKVRLGKAQCAAARSPCEIHPKPIAECGLKRGEGSRLLECGDLSPLSVRELVPAHPRRWKWRQ